MIVLFRAGRTNPLTFSYIFEAGKTSDGKRKVVEKGGFATKTAAYKTGVAAYNDFLHGNIGIMSEKVTLKDFMIAWLDNVFAPKVKLSTMQIYQTFFRNQIALISATRKFKICRPQFLTVVLGNS